MKLIDLNEGKSAVEVAYMHPLLQFTRVNHILMKPFPRLELHFRPTLILLAPLQHLFRKRDTNTLAVCLDNPIRIIQQIVRINYTDIDSFILTGAGVTAAAPIPTAGVNGGGTQRVRHAWAYKPILPHVVEETPEFGISGFGGIEIRPTSHGAQRFLSAAIVGRDAGVWMANEECEVEFRE